MSVCFKEPVAATSSGESPKSTSKSERNAEGQYVRGNRGGPGNPFNRQIGAFRKLIVETSTDDDVRVVARALIQKAREGELAAIKLFLQYVVGKPLPAVDPDRVDVDEWKLCEESNVSGAAGQAVLIDGMPIRLATQFASIMEVSKCERMKKQLADDDVRFAEEARIDAAEQAAIDRGIQESIREHREQQAGKAAPPAPPRPTLPLARPMTVDEIMEMADAARAARELAATRPIANGGNCARDAASREFSAIPTASEISIVGGMPTSNGDIRGRDGLPT